jgi:general stress protein 26
MDQSFRAKIVGILSRSMDMTIATVRPDGAPQATVVSFAHDGLTIYFGCGAEAQKAKNIALEPRVSITVTAPYQNWLQIQGLSISGTASEVTSPDEMETLGRLMMARFPQLLNVLPSDGTAMKLFRVRPSFVSVLDYTQGFGHTDLVEIGADDIAGSRGSLRHDWAAVN